MDQALAARLAKSSALRTKQTNIGNCAACVMAPSFLFNGLSGLPTNQTAYLAKSAVAAQGGIGSWASSFWEYIQPYFAWILLSGLIMGFVGWKFGKYLG